MKLLGTALLRRLTGHLRFDLREKVRQGLLDRLDKGSKIAVGASAVIQDAQSDEAIGGTVDHLLHPGRSASARAQNKGAEPDHEPLQGDQPRLDIHDVFHDRLRFHAQRLEQERTAAEAADFTAEERVALRRLIRLESNRRELQGLLGRLSGTRDGEAQSGRSSFLPLGDRDRANERSHEDFHRNPAERASAPAQGASR